MNQNTGNKTTSWWNPKYVWVMILTVVLSLLWRGYKINSSAEKPETQIRRLAKDEILLIRTPGGMLEVATLKKNEEFVWSTKRICPVINCDGLIKPTITEVRIPAFYTYRIPLSENWTLKNKETHYELIVPSEQPSLPVAMDFTKMEMKTNRGWFSPNANANRESLLRHLGPELAQRSLQKHYFDAQEEIAQKTVVEFAEKWMKEQGSEKKRLDIPIKVIFRDGSG